MNVPFRARKALLACLLLVTGCGTHHLAAEPAARVNGQAISWRDLSVNVDYAAQFYAAGTSSTVICRTNRSLCAALGKQVLGRLIEETVIQNYARQHHIALSPTDRRRATRVSMRMASREAGGSSTPRNRSLLQSIARRELLIQRVEDAVTAGVPVRGPSYNLRRYIIPTYVSKHQAYNAASRLVRKQSPLPPGTQVQTEWKPAFRLSADLHSALRGARPGQYVGPFIWPGGYEVVQVIHLEVHRYSKAARRLLIARRFAVWLRTKLRVAQPTCYRHNNREEPCPLPR